MSTNENITKVDLVFHHIHLKCYVVVAFINAFFYICHVKKLQEPPIIEKKVVFLQTKTRRFLWPINPISYFATA